MSDNRTQARQLANEAVNQGRPLDWFETLYAQADGDATAIPWADLSMNPNLAEWLERKQIDATNRKALVVGCGLGDDAEALSSLGFQVTAFDISHTCIDWCLRRFPNSAVNYQVADLFRPPEAWCRAFDFVVESYTIQALPPDLQRNAIERIADFVANDGTLLVIARGRDPSDHPGELPWPLLRTELGEFTKLGLAEVRFEDYVEAEEPPVRRFRVEYKRKHP